MNKHKELLAQVAQTLSSLNIENDEVKALVVEVNKAVSGREKIVWTPERLEERRLAVNASSVKSKKLARMKAKGFATLEEYDAYIASKKAPKVDPKAPVIAELNEPEETPAEQTPEPAAQEPAAEAPAAKAKGKKK